MANGGISHGVEGPGAVGRRWEDWSEGEVTPDPSRMEYQDHRMAAKLAQRRNMALLVRVGCAPLTSV